MTRNKEKSKDVSIYGMRLMAMAVLMAIAGVVMILSATSISARAEHLSSFAYLSRQSIRVVAGLILMVIASRIDYHRIRPVSFLALMVTLVFLVICLLPGTEAIAPVIGGARRWIHLGSFSFQPSELAKFFLICWAAGYLMRKQDSINSFVKGFVPFGVFVGIFSLLILSQPDFSMAALIVFMVFMVGFIGGIRPAHILLVSLVVLPLVTYKYVVKVKFRIDRVTSYRGEVPDKDGIGYQANQSQIALGSGGITGLGLGQSRQKYFYLPAAHTDFIFSIIGEELGFLGTTATILTYFLLTLFGLKVARGAPDYYGFLLASGLTLMIFTTALMHVAVASGLTPTTGLPLPFLSYGGTNLATTFGAVGILDNISRHCAETAADA
ncbi:MAG: putative lipid II flippase FtsW [Candidatus Glassbacteria bacterium]